MRVLTACRALRRSGPGRAGAIVLTYPATHVARGLGDARETERPLEATLWGLPDSGRAGTNTADGLRIRWSERDGWTCADSSRDVSFRVIEA